MPSLESLEPGQGDEAAVNGGDSTSIPFILAMVSYQPRAGDCIYGNQTSFTHHMPLGNCWDTVSG